MSQLQIEVIEAKDGVLVKSPYGLTHSHTINDMAIRPAGSANYHQWYWCEGVPVIIRPPDKVSHINHRFELNDKSLFVEDKIPLVLEAERQLNDEDRYEWCIIDSRYLNVIGLYSLKYDTVTEKSAPVEFVITSHQKVDAKIGDFSKLNIHGQIPQSYTLDNLLNPNPVLQFRPKFLTGKQLFDIIRASVKANIDTSVAEITSDYDFSFTVQKKIQLTEEEAYQANVAGFKAKKPKYETRYRDDRKIKILEIATESKWGKVLPNLTADNFEELDAKVRLLVKDIIKTINQPIKDCPHCKGAGVLFDVVKI